MGKELIRSTPAAEGINAEYIIDFLNESEKYGAEIHGIMIARHNKIVFEAFNAPYSSNIQHIMHSFTKILTNTAVALAFSDGLLELDDPILKFFPEYENIANDYFRKCTIRDLITMRSGQARSIGGNEWRPLQTSWKEAYFKVPFINEPGKEFLYSSGNSYILSYIVQKLEGKTCHELIKERIGNEIGLSDFSWMLSKEGVNSGGNGIKLTVEDMMRIGILYSNKGSWNGKQLIPEEWINNAFGFENSIPELNGIQYNFHWEHKDDIWAAKGMFGQICGIVPSLDIVFAVTAADQRYSTMDIFQREIVDRLKGISNNETSEDMDEILRQKGLRMTLESKNMSVKSHYIPQKSKYILKPERNIDGIVDIEIYFNKNNLVYVMEDGRGRHEITAGLDCWIHGKTTMTGAYLHHQYEQEEKMISACAYWSDQNILMMEWRYPEMAFFDHLSIKWEEKKIKINRWVNMNSQDLNRPELELKLE